ncbi:MAG: PDZ domain-containing protein, partial [Pseudomonadota bacterium]|nr:PDZ domain-containing protein [Pseudomonadota bacterium]
IGFAIPVSTAKQVMESIVKTGRVVRGWIGVEPNELTPELAQTFGVDTLRGVIVTGVLNGGPAAQAGIRPGDVITQVGGEPVGSVSELLSRIAALVPGQATPFTLQRRGETVQASVTPSQRPQPRQQRQR